MDFGYTGELTIGAFMEALSDPVMVMKVSRASGLPTEWFTSMSEIDMAEWFMKIDKDHSQSISFNEWVEALMKIRQDLFDEEMQMKEFKAEVAKIAEDAFDEGDV